MPEEQDGSPKSHSLRSSRRTTGSGGLVSPDGSPSTRRPRVPEPDIEASSSEEGKRPSILQVASLNITSVVAEVLKHEKETYTRSQKILQQVISHHLFEVATSVVIAVSIFSAVIETDREAACLMEGQHSTHCIAQTWLIVSNNVTLAIYIAEAVLRIYACRWRYFTCRWNRLDFCIVATAIMDELLTRVAKNHLFPHMTVFRLFRIFRLFKAVRLLTSIRELYLLFHGLASAMRSIWWGLVMMIVFLSLWSMLAVQIIHPINMSLDHDEDDWCQRAFSSVMMSNLVFFQTVVTGDSWGHCAIPIMEMDPWMSFPIFIGVIFTIQIGFMNLILAVIVEQAAAARLEDEEQCVREKQADLARSEKKIFQHCKEIDRDHSGDISVEEFLSAFDENPKLASLFENMHIERDIIHDLFYLMDSDGSGSVTYAEFIQHVHKAKTQETKLLVLSMKCQLCKEIRNMRSQISSELKDALAAKAVEVPEVGLKDKVGKRTAEPSCDHWEHTATHILGGDGTTCKQEKLSNNGVGINDVTVEAVHLVELLNAASRRFMLEVEKQLAAFARETDELRQHAWPHSVHASHANSSRYPHALFEPQLSQLPSAQLQDQPGKVTPEHESPVPMAIHLHLEPPHHQTEGMLVLPAAAALPRATPGTKTGANRASCRW